MFLGRHEKKDSLSVLDVEQIELKGFSRSITEIEWLLMLLVTLYYVAPGTFVDNPLGLHISLVLYGFFVIGFHYITSDANHSYKTLLFETVVMIVFITWSVWNTGSIDSPLINLYLLVIISSAITLGKLVTFLEIALIGVFYFIFGFQGKLDYSFAGFSELMIYFSPFILIAYITTMLVADLNYGRRMFKALSEIDEMTSLLNKRSFRPLFYKAIEVAVKYKQPISVMMIDADNLKEVNDRFGHKAGDALIRNIAESIQVCLRASDIICRYGGDEFVAVLPQLSSDRALEAAERLRVAVENLSFDVDGARISSTVSIGIATYPLEVNVAEQLLTKADEALYESKRSGRNVVKKYSQIEKSEMEVVDLFSSTKNQVRGTD